MILTAIASFVTLQYAVRDDYGVPHIKAATWGEAFEIAGYAVAEDRMWQMENSRRLARGRMAEAFGAQYFPSDRDVLRVAYTDEELQAQIDKMPAKIQEAFRRYADGINRFIAEESRLPKGYADFKFKPEKWTPLDSAAIACRFLQTFGRGGAGEIRNMALFSYIQGQKAVQGRAFDVFDDFAWQNDTRARTTASPSEDPLAKSHPTFPSVTRAISEKHVASLPKANLLELLPGIRVAEKQESTRVAELVGAPYKSGSYCIVVGPSRSANGKPMLLSGPQMGFRNPSIVHEMSIEAPGIKAVGMDLPGVPGILVGHTGYLAWGLTTGVADTEEVMFAKQVGETHTYGSTTKPLTIINFPYKVSGGEEGVIPQQRSEFGPVVLKLNSSGTLFIRRSSFWKRELESFAAVYDLYEAKSPADIRRALDKATLNFNFFYAATDGNFGWHYAGNVPIRAEGLDPRFPTPLTPENDWKGYIPKDKMPYLANPKSGLIFNWNNKPVSWWPNWDTPVWGRIFRNEILAQQLTKPKLTLADVEMAPWQIARMDYNWPFFAKMLGTLPELAGFDGRMLDGSRDARLYSLFFDALREEIFAGHIGNLISPDNFRQAVQPTVMLDALEGRTRFNYLAGRKKEDILRAAMAKAIERRGTDESTWRFAASRINGVDPMIPYSDRGTYIQIVELFDQPSGRNVLPPGVAATGPYALSQADLARTWTYKPMRFQK